MQKLIDNTNKFNKCFFKYDLYQIVSGNFSNVLQWYYPWVPRLKVRKYTFGKNLRDRYVEGTESGTGPGVIFYKIWVFNFSH